MGKGMKGRGYQHHPGLTSRPHYRGIRVCKTHPHPRFSVMTKVTDRKVLKTGQGDWGSPSKKKKKMKTHRQRYYRRRPPLIKSPPGRTPAGKSLSDGNGRDSNLHHRSSRDSLCNNGSSYSGRHWPSATRVSFRKQLGGGCASGFWHSYPVTKECVNDCPVSPCASHSLPSWPRRPSRARACSWPPCATAFSGSGPILCFPEKRRPGPYLGLLSSAWPLDAGRVVVVA
jgi:hypothetical protein